MDSGFRYAAMEVPSQTPNLAANIDGSLSETVFRVADGQNRLKHLFAFEFYPVEASVKSGEPFKFGRFANCHACRQVTMRITSRRNKHNKYNSGAGIALPS